MTTTKQPKEAYLLKVTVAVNRKVLPYRTIALLGNSTLYKLAQAITEAFDFNFDHMFGFYDNLENWASSKEVYELDPQSSIFNDISSEKARDVKKAKVAEVFDENEKKMLFIFDFGDEWLFLVESVGKEPVEDGRTYPSVIESVGKAPRQY